MPKVRIKEILKKKKINDRQFAILVGYTSKNVGRILHEDYDPKLSVLIKWASALKVKVRDLIEE